MDAKNVIKAFWAGYERGDLDATWERFVSPEIVIHPSSGYTFTRDSWLAAEKALYHAFDDVRIEVLDQLVEGDKVATRWALTARQHSDFFGVASQGRSATLTGTTVDIVQDGRIVEHWAEVGVPLFLQKLAGAA